MGDDVPAKRPCRLDREVTYTSPWVNLFVDRVRMPAGQIIDRCHVLDFEKEAVTAVVENPNGELLLIESYRYVIDSIEWETPAGVISEGESVLDAAQREVLEETGYCTESPRLLYSYNPVNGMANKVFHMAHCRAQTTTGVFDRNEVRAVHWRSRSQVKSMIGANQIRDGFSLTALLLFLARDSEK